MISFSSNSIKGGRKQISPMDTKLRQLYDAIRDYREPKANRQLALIFMKLPSKTVSKLNHIPINYKDFWSIHIETFFVNNLTRIIPIIMT